MVQLTRTVSTHCSLYRTQAYHSTAAWLKDFLLLYWFSNCSAAIWWTFPRSLTFIWLKLTSHLVSLTFSILVVYLKMCTYPTTLGIVILMLLIFYSALDKVKTDTSRGTISAVLYKSGGFMKDDNVSTCLLTFCEVHLRYLLLIGAWNWMLSPFVLKRIGSLITVQTVIYEAHEWCQSNELLPKLP